MGRLIDIDVLFDYFGNDAIDKTTRSNIEYFVSEKGTVKAIPKADYENRLKADKNNSGNDCISRAQAIERLKLNFPISDGADNSRDRHRYMQALADLQAIKELPPVKPQEPKTGH